MSILRPLLWEMHDTLFTKKDEWAEAENINTAFLSFVKELDLDEFKFNDCFSNGKYTQAVQQDYELGQKVGVTGTPTFFINGQKLVGAQPFSAFQQIIEEELK